MRRFLGIYLAYYPRYVDDCSKFHAFLRSMDSNAHFVVVCNSEVQNLFHDKYPIVVRGDNSYREFSGWDVGIRAAHEALGDLDKFTVVFANDTFRAHNNFGWISRFAFRRAFLDAHEEKSPPAISGEVWHFDGHYEIDSLRANKWVATYLFSISGSLLSKIHELAPAGHASRFYAAHEFPLHFATTISENLALHINRGFAG
jgi:hypothetical protein